MRGASLASCVLLLAVFAAADPAAPPSGPVLSDADLQSILKEDEKEKEGTEHRVEPWLPYGPGDQRKLDSEFQGQWSPKPFAAAHLEAHELLDQYKQQKMPLDQLKQGISDIVYGVRHVIDTGLTYADVKHDASLTEAQRRQKLAEARDQMVQARGQLEAVPFAGGANDRVKEANGTALGALLNHQYDHDDLRNGFASMMWHVDPQGMSQALASHPADPGLQVAAGEMALSAKDAARAKEHFNDALSLDPGNADALAGRAAANLDLGNMRDAAQDAKDALRINPGDGGAKAVLALAHDTVGGNVSIDKSSPFSGSGAAAGWPQAASAGRWAGGGGAMPRADGAGLQSSAYTRDAARALRLGDAEAAARSATHAILLDPKNAEAYGLRALAQARAGRYDEALKDAMAALALDPSSSMAHNARAKALNQMGLYQEALAAADDAIRAGPRNAYAYYMKAMALSGLGDRKRMLSALGQAAALDARYQDAYDLAKSAPEEKDLSFLFPEEGLAAARAASAVSRGGGRSLGLPYLVGGALLLFGMLHFAFARIAPRLRAGYTAAVRTGPSLDAASSGAPLPLSTPPPMSTQRLVPMGTVLRGQYRRLGQIGSSVHGSVYEGMDQALERRVVIRKLRADMRAADRERLLTPARAAAGLAHAGIAPVYSVFEEGESLYLVSEFAPGRSLRDLLAAKGPLSWEEAQPLFRQVAEAVDYAHGRGVTHGALKASNIMITAEGRAKLVDFGLARGPADKEADLQSLAACLREAIAGLSPARLDAVDAALAKARGQLTSAAQVVDVVEAGLASAA